MEDIVPYVAAVINLALLYQQVMLMVFWGNLQLVPLKTSGHLAINSGLWPRVWVFISYWQL